MRPSVAEFGSVFPLVNRIPEFVKSFPNSGPEKDRREKTPEKEL